MTKYVPPTPDVVLVSLPAKLTDHILINSPHDATAKPARIPGRVGFIKISIINTNGSGT